MVAATALTLVFVPVFYAMIERLRERRSGAKPALDTEPFASGETPRPAE
jgi:HAE1 family hydrophobic/amphiphilic exporter-1